MLAEISVEFVGPPEEMEKEQVTQREVQQLHENMLSIERKREILKNLDLFVLDNSLRETTVGQIFGHTLENKWEI